MVQVLRAPISQNLSSLAKLLREKDIPHKFIETSGEQVLFTTNEQYAQQIKDIIKLQQTAPPSSHPPVSSRNDIRKKTLLHLCRLPATSALIIIAVVCWPITWSLEQNQFNNILELFVIVPVAVTDTHLTWSNITNTLVSLQLWRLFTPTLLHFGVAHLLFNILWIYELGRRIEREKGSAYFILFTIIIAVASNLSQYFAQYFTMSEGYLFGGLSGVVYGFFGFILLSFYITKNPIYELNKSIITGMLIILVLFSTNITSIFGLNIANAAHWGGLCSGILLALTRIPIQNRFK